MMEGSEAGIMDDKTQIRWTLGSSHDTQRPRSQHPIAGVSERTETLRARLITAIVEALAHGSNPRLGRTRYVRTAA
jgi:hypothetical protein